MSLFKDLANDPMGYKLQAKIDTHKSVPTVETLDEINEAIEVARAASKDLEKRCEHKDYYSNPYARELIRLHKMKEFIELGATVEPKTNGLIINGKFHVGWKQNRWRQVGKAKWYWYTDAQQFMDKYVHRK